MNKKLVGFIAKTGAIVGIAVIASSFIQEGMGIARETAINGYKSAISWVTRVEVVQQYIPLPKKDLHQVLDEAAKEHRVPKFLLLSMIEQESGRAMRPNRIRFEPWVYKKMGKKPFPNEIENQMLASSIGLMQVIPYFHTSEKECKVSFEELFNPEVNVKCGARIMRDCLNSNPNGSHYDRIRKALKCYNGGDAYPDQVLDRVARLALENMPLE